MVPEERQAESARRRLRVLSVVVPLTGLALLYPLYQLLLRIWPAPMADSLAGLLMLSGVLTFSWVVFRLLARQDTQLARQHADLVARYQTECRLRDQLERVEQAAIAIASASPTAAILQRLVELAREIIPAPYAALGVLGPHGVIDDLYTVGVSVEARSQMEPPSPDHGLLGVTRTEGRALRVDDLSRDPRRTGFPPGHPAMTSVLAVPIRLAGRITGTLSVAGTDTDTFTEEDERLLTLIAGHAAVAIEQGRLTEQVRRLAVSAERERIRIALQDSAIQTLYAVNLDLEMTLDDLDQSASAVGTRINQAIERIGTAIADIRRGILGPNGAAPAANEGSVQTAEREETHV